MSIDTAVSGHTDLHVLHHHLAESGGELDGRLLFCNPSREVRTGGDETNRRTRAEPQWIVGQAYFHTYSTLSQLSRLQTICPGDSSKL